MGVWSRWSGRAALALVASLVASAAHATPALQLYIEGAAFDHDTATWVTNRSNLRLWVIGDTSRYGNILDVQLVTAFRAGETGSLTITPTHTSLFSNPVLASMPLLNNTLGGTGTMPRMSDGNGLPARDVYGPGTRFQQWGLGDFTRTDAPVGDFVDHFPVSFTDQGQINVYAISITGYTTVHFDTFNHVEAHNHGLYGPMSNDLPDSAVPEPGTLVLLGFSFLGTAGYGFLRRRK